MQLKLPYIAAILLACASCATDTRRETFAPPISDREKWDATARSTAGVKFIKDAEAELATPLPESPDELFLDYTRNGDRWRWQKVNFKRRNRIGIFAFAEGLENKGRFVAAYEETAKSICAERTWLIPAEDPELDNYYGRIADIELGSAHVAGDLAMADAIIGGKLKPEIRLMIERNVRERVIIPFMDMVSGKTKIRAANGWLTYPNNHNAVNLCGVCVAGLRFAKSAEERALIIEKSAELIRNYLKSFSKDGYCKEGVGYWNYGFIHFAILSEMLRRETDGGIDPLLWTEAAKPALYGFESEICGGVALSYSDSDPSTKPDPRLLGYISRRFGLGLKDFEDASLQPAVMRNSILPNMVFCFPQNSAVKAQRQKPQTGIRTWFSDDWAVLISRTEKGQAGDFGACIIGGDNNASHNHNDIGSFIVACGGVQMLCDPGVEAYTKKTFGPERYASKAHNSLGHSVPVIDGFTQRTGKEARGVVVEKSFSALQDYVKLDMRSAYGSLKLLKLERSFKFNRGAKPSLEICDEFAFKAPASFEEALIVFGDFERMSDGSLAVSYKGRTVSIRIETGQASFDIARERFDEHMLCEVKPLRIGLKLKDAVKEGVVKIIVEPK